MQQPFKENAYKFWNEWEIHILVLLSLFLQIMLILLGPRRNYETGSWISILVWISYLSADSVAIFCLGTLSRNQGEYNSKDPDNALMGIWAPFLLLHLGGPDTITAYSLEDNELWLRHLLGLSVQVMVAFYILLKSPFNTIMSSIGILVFVAGIIKYGERTWVLRSASTKEIRSSLLSASTKPTLNLEGIPRDAHYLHESYFWFEKQLKLLFADLNPYGDELVGGSIFGFRQPSNEAKQDFRLVELQLKFLYDVLYTKAPFMFTVTGICVRVVCSASLIAALVLFSIVVYKHTYSKTYESIITHCLLIGSVILDMWAFVMLILSDWTMLWVTRHKNTFPNWIYSAVTHASFAVNRDKQWSRKLPQHCLIDFCIANRTSKCLSSDLMYSLSITLKRNWANKWVNVDDHLIELIYKKILEKHHEFLCSGYDKKRLKKLLAQREDVTLARYGLHQFRWTLDEMGFNFSVFIWHIATTICFYNDEGETEPKRTISRSLSDYMLYMVVMRPALLPKLYGGDRVTEDSYKEALTFFRKGEEVSSSNRKEACRALLQNPEFDRETMSALEQGCSLAKDLQGNNEKWSFLSELWAEMLIHAAVQCGWRDHAQQLGQGGELLTNVSLLMANLGLSDHYIQMRDPEL